MAARQIFSQWSPVAPNFVGFGFSQQWDWAMPKAAMRVPNITQPWIDARMHFRGADEPHPQPRLALTDVKDRAAKFLWGNGDYPTMLRFNRRSSPGTVSSTGFIAC